jgi:hypothetical protein
MRHFCVVMANRVHFFIFAFHHDKMTTPQSSSPSKTTTAAASPTMDNNKKKEDDDTTDIHDVSMGTMITEWSRCLSGRHQLDHLYRFGKFDECSRQAQDVRTGIRATFFMRDKQVAQDLWKSTYWYQQTHVSPTVGVIWPKKDPPGWY